MHLLNNYQKKKVSYAGHKGNKLKAATARKCNHKIGIYWFQTSSKFTRTKDQTLKEHQHDIVYHAECPENNFAESYTG